MNGEIDLGGVLVHPLLLAAALAVALSRPIELVLMRAGVYRYVWHRGLFDLAMLVVLWGAVTALLTYARVLFSISRF